MSTPRSRRVFFLIPKAEEKIVEPPKAKEVGEIVEKIAQEKEVVQEKVEQDIKPSKNKVRGVAETVEEVIENYMAEEKVELSEKSFLQNDLSESGILQPAKWFMEVVDNQQEGKELKLTAKIDKGWHLYATDIPDGGPIPTSVLLNDKDGNIEWLGELKAEGNKISKFDEVFEMDLSWYEDKVVFSRRFIPKANQDFVSGEVEFMLCDDERCLAPELLFFSTKIDQKGQLPLSEKSPDVAKVDNGSKGEQTEAFDWAHGSADCAGNSNNTEKKGNWMIFLLGFGGGLLALLTPCVFPMIPLTVSFFTKGGKDRKKGLMNAAIYGVSIVAIYVALGTIITGLLGPSALNAMSTNAFFNLLFFVVFIVFAISFFGFFEITLPASWINKSDQAADKGGFIGIFFMAFTLSLVSFSCTGPIIGTLLVEAATGGGASILGRIPVRPLLGMLGFSLALAIPFTLFAAFPSWLNSLPKSGGWLDYVKKVLGFLELALAFKFLSIPDMTYNWGILKYELFLVLWILIFLGLALYSFGILKFPKDGPIKKLGIGRIGVGIASLLFSVYMTTGLINYKPLSLLSGLAPPTHYNYFNNNEDIKENDGPSKEGCPADLYCFKDYYKAKKYAAEIDKPLLIDFTGFGCVNCRKMEENVWTEEEVNQVMQEYVLVSLYVDDKKALPEEEQYVSNATGKEKKIKSIGNKWSDFQASHFKTNSQPYYVLVDPKADRILNKPEGYLPDKSAFKEFLNCGLDNFEEKVSQNL